jgi:putative ABC transport system permease protein
MKMFFRMLRKIFARSKKEKILIFLIVACGATLASVMLNLALNVGDKMNQELKSYGANLQIVPNMNALPAEVAGAISNPLEKQNVLQLKDLSKLKTIFWANNIVAFTPYFDTTGKISTTGETVQLVGTWFNKEVKMGDNENFTTGIEKLKSWWKVDGRWPDENGPSMEAVVGKQVAEKLRLKPGDSLPLLLSAQHGSSPSTFRVTGVVDTGGSEDESIFVPLQTIQNLMNLPGKISSAEVSAVTVPDNELAKKVGTDPTSLREKDFDQWYCTAYTGAIAYQIEEAIPNALVKPIRQISQAEGTILTKIQYIMLVISIVAVLSSALAISILMNSKVRERAKEIALMKALGATDLSVTTLFLSESLISGVVGGIFGYGIGAILAHIAGESVFGTALSIKMLGLPVIILLSAGITVLGSYPAVQSIVKLEPIQALQGR